MIAALEMPEIETARGFAILAHGDQQYSDGPYINHLTAVAETVVNYGHASVELLQAAYLHDVVEDTPADVEVVCTLFGFRVAQLVWAVTNEPGANHVAKFAMTAPKIAAVPQAAILKEADRLANVHQSVQDDGKYLAMYQKEHPLFKAMLFGKGDPVMEADLDRMLKA